MELLHRGSVKDLYQYSQTQLCFEFSDRYSIFDWGEMPDLIEGKGECLAEIAELFFEHLQKEGFSTHFLRRLNAKQLLVEAVEVVHPASGETPDYSLYQKNPENTLVPLEVIFRYGVPKGSSLLKRLDDPQALEELGLNKRPQEGDLFDAPLVEFTTKLESSDRLLTKKEAQQISGMSDQELADLQMLTQKLAHELRLVFSQLNITLWDGKFEFAFGPKKNERREIVLVDSIGPDELRLSYKNIQLSKECLRQFYADSQWKNALDRSKLEAKARGILDWKSICQNEFKASPQNLSQKQLQQISNMYKTLANELHKSLRSKPLSQDCLDLGQWVEQWHQLMAEGKI